MDGSFAYHREKNKFDTLSKLSEKRSILDNVRKLICSSISGRQRRIRRSYRLTAIKQLQELIEDSTIDIRYESLILLCELIPQLGEQIDHLLMEIFPRVLTNLGHWQKNVRLAAVHFLNIYLKHTNNLQNFLQLFVFHGLENPQESIRRGSLISISSVIDSDLAAENLYRLIESLGKQLKDAKPTFFYTVYFALRKVHQIIDDEMFLQQLGQVDYDALSLYNWILENKKAKSNVLSYKQMKDEEGSRPFVEVGLAYGIFDPYILEELKHSDTETRISGVESIKETIQSSWDIDDLEAHLDDFLELIGKLLSDRSKKIRLCSLEIMDSAIDKIGFRLGNHLHFIVPSLVRNFGCRQRCLRKNAARIVHQMMKQLPPMAIIRKLLEDMSEQKPTIRKEIIDRVTASLLSFSAYNFDTKFLCHTLLPVLNDRVFKVKQSVIECLVVLARAMGSAMDCFTENTIFENDKIAMEVDEILSIVEVRAANNLLPTCSSDGMVHYVRPDKDVLDKVCVKSSTFKEMEVYRSLLVNFDRRAEQTLNKMKNPREISYQYMKSFSAAGRKDTRKKPLIDMYDDSAELQRGSTFREPFCNDGDDSPCGTYEGDASTDSTHISLGGLSTEAKKIKSSRTVCPEPRLRKCDPSEQQSHQRDSKTSLTQDTDKFLPDHFDKLPPINNAGIPRKSKSETLFKCSYADIDSKFPDRLPVVDLERKGSSRVPKNHPDLTAPKDSVRSSRTSVNTATTGSYSLLNIGENSSTGHSSVFHNEQQRNIWVNCDAVEVNPSTHNSDSSTSIVSPRPGEPLSNIGKECEMVEYGTMHSQPEKNENENQTFDQQEVGASEKSPKFKTKTRRRRIRKGTYCQRKTEKITSSDPKPAKPNVSQKNEKAKSGFSADACLKDTELPRNIVPKSLKQNSGVVEGDGMKTSRSNLSVGKRCTELKLPKIVVPQRKVKAAPKEPFHIPPIKTPRSWDQSNVVDREDKSSFKLPSIFAKNQDFAEPGRSNNPGFEDRDTVDTIPVPSSNSMGAFHSTSDIEACANVSNNRNRRGNNADLSIFSQPSQTSSTFEGVLPRSNEETDPESEVTLKMDCQKRRSLHDGVKDLEPFPCPQNESEELCGPIKILSPKAIHYSWATSFEESVVNIQPLANPAMAGQLMKQVIAIFSGDEWTLKIEAMHTILTVAKFHSAALDEYLQPIISKLLTETKTTRPPLAGCAMLTIGYMFMMLKRSLDSKLKLVFSVLLEKCGAKLFSGSFNVLIKSLFYMMQGTQPQKAAMTLLTVGCRHANKSVREISAQFLLLLVEKMEVSKSWESSKKLTEELLSCAAFFTEDGSPRTRHCGKKILKILTDSSDLAKLLCKCLSESVCRNINRLLESLRAKDLDETVLPVRVICTGVL